MGSGCAISCPCRARARRWISDIVPALDGRGVSPRSFAARPRSGRMGVPVRPFAVVWGREFPIRPFAVVWEAPPAAAIPPASGRRALRRVPSLRVREADGWEFPTRPFAVVWEAPPAAAIPPASRRRALRRAPSPRVREAGGWGFPSARLPWFGKNPAHAGQNAKTDERVVRLNFGEPPTTLQDSARGCRAQMASSMRAVAASMVGRSKRRPRSSRLTGAPKNTRVRRKSR